MASAFRAYFIDGRNHVREIVPIEAEGVDAACALAETLWAKTGFAAVEIWDGARLVGRHAAPRWYKMVWPFYKHESG